MSYDSASTSDHVRFDTVSADWISEHGKDGDVRVLDTRSNAMEYFPGHVPGAVHLSDFSLRGPIDGLPAQYLEPETLASLFERAGVSDDTHVVVYADGEQTIGATMAMYALELLGFQKVSYLDGGWSGYREQHDPSQEYPQYRSAGCHLTPRAGSRIGITLDEMRRHLESPGAVIIDARPERYYLGQPPKTWMRDGHVPGAVNIDWHGLMTPENLSQLRPTPELEDIFAANGIEREQDIAVMCGTSREASMEFFVLRHLLGFPRVRLYEGSWTEWSSHSELDVETTPNRLPALVTQRA